MPTSLITLRHSLIPHAKAVLPKYQGDKRPHMRLNVDLHLGLNIGLNIGLRVSRQVRASPLVKSSSQRHLQEQLFQRQPIAPWGKNLRH
jgi:hypothetical protein